MRRRFGVEAYYEFAARTRSHVAINTCTCETGAEASNNRANNVGPSTNFSALGAHFHRLRPFESIGAVLPLGSVQLEPAVEPGANA